MRKNTAMAKQWTEFEAEISSSSNASSKPAARDPRWEFNAPQWCDLTVGAVYDHEGPIDPWFLTFHA